MPIDPNQEEPLSLANAAKTKPLPVRRGGKRPHVSCLYRWSTVGCRGVILETIQIGGTRCTSREALSRFFARLTEQAGVTPTVQTPARRRKAVERAIRDLEEQGA